MEKRKTITSATGFVTKVSVDLLAEIFQYGKESHIEDCVPELQDDEVKKVEAMFLAVSEGKSEHQNYGAAYIAYLQVRTAKDAEISSRGMTLWE